MGRGRSKPRAIEEIDRIRDMLEYPPGARQTRPDGSVVYVRSPLPSLLNLQTILGQDPDYYAHLGWNEFTGEPTWAGEPFSDHLETSINVQVQEKYGVKSTTERVREMMLLLARAHPYHPVRDYLTALTWDGRPRIDDLLIKYGGAADVPLNRAMARRWLFGCLARVFRPGCQMDTTLILVGKQGVGKSSFFRSLAPKPEWFSDTAMNLGSKDAFQQLHGVWIYEVAELSALRVKDAESVKAFLTARVDRYRPPYARNLVRIDRQVVFVGTTNEAEFLDDPTGARRFWPIEVGNVDVAGITADRDQIWAEAVEAYLSEGEAARWHLTQEESEQLDGAHQRYARSDSWSQILVDWMRKNCGEEGVDIGRIMSEALELEMREQHRGNSMRVASLLSSAGYYKARTVRDGVRAWRWRR